ncbi:hypothetical protein ACFL2A_04875 [Thermodesulfobacteriota bacterium]
MKRKLIAISLTLITIFLLSAVLSTAEETKKAEAAKSEEIVKKGPEMGHDKTLPGELCVGCHMESKDADPESITPKINNKHDVCNKCHKEDGTTEGHCGCEDADDPMDCEQCHTTPAIGDNPSADEMNDLCLKCH